MGIKEAVPVLTVAQIFGNASRFWFGRHELQWKPVLYFLAGSLPMAILSSSLYSGMKADWIFKLVGGFLVLVVVYRHLNFAKKVELGQPKPEPLPNTFTFDQIQRREYSLLQTRTGLHAKLDYALNGRNHLSLYSLLLRLDDA